MTETPGIYQPKSAIIADLPKPRICDTVSHLNRTVQNSSKFESQGTSEGVSNAGI
jgi:hypothetical protein